MMGIPAKLQACFHFLSLKYQPSRYTTSERTILHYSLLLSSPKKGAHLPRHFGSWKRVFQYHKQVITKLSVPLFSLRRSGEAVKRKELASCSTSMKRHLAGNL